MANLRRRSTRQLISLLSNKKLADGTYEYRIEYDAIFKYSLEKCAPNYPYYYVSYRFLCSTLCRDCILEELGEYTGYSDRF